MDITIGPVSTATRADKLRISVPVANSQKNGDLWFEIDAAHQDALSTDVLDAFVVAMLVPAILQGKSLTVNGPMSSKLYYNITSYLLPILCDFYEKPRAVTIRPASLVSDPAVRGKGVITGFSGGVDSFCLYHEHTGDRASADYHVTHFLYNNVGSHGQTDSDREIFLTRFERLKAFARAEGKAFISVDSNLDDFIGLGFVRTHTIRNVVPPLLFQNAVCRFLYSSGHTYDETSVTPYFGMARLDPVILPLLSTERLDCISSGAQHTRVAKTRLVAEIAASRDYLDICVRPLNTEGFINCGSCWKCARTITTLAIYGQAEKYGNVFNMEKFRRIEKLYLIDALASDASFSREVGAAIKEAGYPVPRVVRLLAALMPARGAAAISERYIATLSERPRVARVIDRLLSL